MKYCEKCGKELMDEAVVCTGCGCPVVTKQANNSPSAPAQVVSKKAKRAKIFGILSILILAPLGLPGIILANSSKNETGGVMNKDAKTGLTCSIIGLAIWGLMLVLYFGKII